MLAPRIVFLKKERNDTTMNLVVQKNLNKRKAAVLFFAALCELCVKQFRTLT